MNNPCRWLVILLVLGCSKLTESKGGVVALELRLQSPAAVEQNDILALTARALDANGDSVATPVCWRTLDDSVLTILPDSANSECPLFLTNLVTTTRTAGTARVQASAGSLRSDLVTLTLRPRSDTLRLGPDSIIVVAAGDTTPDTLRAVIETKDSAGNYSGVSGTSILYDVVDTAAARGKVALTNGRLAYRATTGTSGAPTTAVVIRKIAGATPPDTVQVRVSAQRPSGQAVPGSGQQFTLLFQ